MDEEGEFAAEEIKKRFGDRCYRITPTKDINELLQKQGYDGARTVLEGVETPDGKTQTPCILLWNLRSASMPFLRTRTRTQGFCSGWEKLDEEDIRFRPSELWGLTGINGHGKSMWLGQLCLNAIEQGNKVLISAEMTPERLPNATSGRWVRASARALPRQATRLARNSLWLYEDRITPSAKKLLACFEYAYARYGINVFVVDSLTNMVDSRTIAQRSLSRRSFTSSRPPHPQFFWSLTLEG